MPRCNLRLFCWQLRQKICCSRVPNGLAPDENNDPWDGWSGDSDELARTHSQKLSEYRRKYSDAMESRTSHTGAPPGTLGGAHALHYQQDEQLDRLSTQFNMAGVLDDMGEWEEARQMYLEVISGRKQLLGPDDRATLDAEWYLAMLLIDDAGEWHGSRRLWGSVAKGYSSAYGQCHANTHAARCCVCCCCICVPCACCCGRRKRRADDMDSGLLDTAGGGSGGSSGGTMMTAAP